MTIMQKQWKRRNLLALSLSLIMANAAVYAADEEVVAESADQTEAAEPVAQAAVTSEFNASETAPEKLPLSSDDDANSIQTTAPAATVPVSPSATASATTAEAATAEAATPSMVVPPAAAAGAHA